MIASLLSSDHYVVSGPEEGPHHRVPAVEASAIIEVLRAGSIYASVHWNSIFFKFLLGQNASEQQQQLSLMDLFIRYKKKPTTEREEK